MSNPFSNYNTMSGNMFAQTPPSQPQLYQTTTSYGYQSQTPTPTRTFYQTSSGPFSVQQLQTQQSQARQFPTQTLQFQTQQYQPQTFVQSQTTPVDQYEQLDFLEAKVVGHGAPMTAVHATGHVPHNPFVSTASVGSYTFGMPSTVAVPASPSFGEERNHASDLGRLQLQLLQQQQQLLQQQNQLQEFQRLQQIQSQQPIQPIQPIQPAGFSTPQNAIPPSQAVPPPPPNVDVSVWRELPAAIREEVLKNPSAATATAFSSSAASRSMAQQPKPEPEPEPEQPRLTDKQLVKQMYKEQSNEYYNRKHFGGQKGRRFNE